MIGLCYCQAKENKAATFSKPTHVKFYILVYYIFNELVLNLETWTQHYFWKLANYIKTHAGILSWDVAS